jgi:hypothetical protein
MSELAMSSPTKKKKKKKQQQNLLPKNKEENEHMTESTINFPKQSWGLRTLSYKTECAKEIA